MTHPFSSLITTFLLSLLLPYSLTKTFIINNITIQTAIELYMQNGDYNKYGPISQWDASLITDMSSLFNLKNITSDLSQWDVSNVTNMSNMFTLSETFNSDLSSWNVRKVNDMYNMFGRAYAFNSDLNSWDVSNVTDFRWMFYKTNYNHSLCWNVVDAQVFNIFEGSLGLLLEYPDCQFVYINNDNIRDALFQFSLGNVTKYGDIDMWNVTSVTNMKELFKDHVEFNENISNWDVSNVTNLDGMFYNATIFNQDLSDWDISNVNTMNNMFMYSFNFTHILCWNMTNITHTNMFNYSQGSLEKYPDCFDNLSTLTPSITPIFGSYEVIKLTRNEILLMTIAPFVCIMIFSVCAYGTTRWYDGKMDSE